MRPAATTVPAKRGRPTKKKVEPVKDAETEPEPETEIEILFEDEKLEQLRRFCEYAVMFYIPYFLTSCWLRKLLPPLVPEPHHCPVLPHQ